MAKKQTIHINGSDIIVLKQKTDDYYNVTEFGNFSNFENCLGLTTFHNCSTSGSDVPVTLTHPCHSDPSGILTKNRNGNRFTNKEGVKDPS